MATKTWTGLGSTNNWSEGANWDLSAVPVTTDAIVFDATSVKNCTIDNLGTWSGGTVTVNATYTGSITQNVAMTTAAFVMNGGSATAWTQAANFTSTTFSVTTGNILFGYTVSSGNFQCSTFTVSSGFVNFSGVGTCLCTGAVAFSTAVGTPTVAITCPPGTWETRAGWSHAGTDTITFNANGGTVQFSGGAKTINVPSLVGGAGFNKCTFPNATGTQTISAGTVIPLGADPTTSMGALTLNGTITASGVWTFNTATALTVGSGATVSGALTRLILASADLTINAAAAAFPTLLPLTFQGGGTQTVTSTVIVLGPVTVTPGTGGFTVAANTTVKIASGTQTVNNTLTVTGTLNLDGNTFEITGGSLSTGAASTIIGPGTLKLTDVPGTVNAGTTISGAVNINMNITGATGRSFAGGGKTFGLLSRTGSGSGTLTITGTNTFSSGILDNQGLVAHSIVFPNVTTTVGFFNIRGSSGKLVTLARTGAAGTFTLTATSGLDIYCDYISVSNSTVDASPRWYAGANSTDGGTNTNWIFTAPPVKTKKGFSIL